MIKIRLDALLVEKGLADTRSKAQAIIGAGMVYVGGMRIDKAGHQLSSDVEVTIKGQEHPYVSRGGMKLAHALQQFGLSCQQKLCIDVGASTGGFTDVLLQNGAAKVYAVDVGHGQLDWKLRQDSRVVVLEKTNARYLDTTIIPVPVDWVVCDASFISLKKVLPAALSLCSDNAVLVALIKPQFEVGKKRVGKGGVVRDSALHLEVCEDIKHWVQTLEGWSVVGITESPVKGPKGNVEFLLCAIKAEKMAATQGQEH